ncbi:hypothetical protein BGZ82_009748 [Podila clonocystis]|nr:hypothetical protein BGZ82_009748 [Podila clonocystis]
MSNNAVTQLNEFVVDSVINRSRRVFEEMGFNETILEVLQKGWENKIGLIRQASPQGLMQVVSSSLLSLESSGSQTTDPGIMHASVQAAAEIKLEQVARSPTLTPATPAPALTSSVPVLTRPPSPLSALLLALKPEALPDIKPSNTASNAASLSGVSNQIGLPDLPAPSPAPNHRRSVRNVNTSTRTSSSRTTRNSSKTSLRGSPRIRQTDGASVYDTDLEISNMSDLDEPTREDVHIDMSFTLTLSKKAANKARRAGLGPLEGMVIGQVDGNDESGDQEELLGSDLDESDEDEDATSNLILCQYDKVDKQSKTGKWKLHLTYGMMSIDNCDYLFKEAKGDCEWLDGPKWTS